MRTYLIVAGLVIGAVFGMVGSLLPDGTGVTITWTIAAMAFVVALLLMAVRQLQLGQNEVAAGFAIIGLSWTILFTVWPTHAIFSEPAFAGAASLYFLGLLLVSLPNVFAIWTRAAGVISAVLFEVISGLLLFGQKVASDSPLVFAAYILLDVAIVGYIVYLIGQERATPSTS